MADSSSYKDFSTDGIYRASPCCGFWCEMKIDQFLAQVDFGEGGYLGFWFEMGYYKKKKQFTFLHLFCELDPYPKHGLTIHRFVQVNYSCNSKYHH